MKKMKSVLIIFLCLTAVVMEVSAGGAAGASGASGKTARVGAKGSLPLATTKPVLSVYIAGGIGGNVTSFDYKDNALTKKYADETGIDLRITGTPWAGAQEHLNVMLNTGEYPDVIILRGATLEIDYYARQGTFIALDPYDPLSFPNIKKLFEGTAPQVMAAKLRASDGKMYALPKVDQGIHGTYSTGRMWYFMPWTRDNGRKKPETIDEFTEFLRFAKANDLNKNGKKDEMGIVFNKDDTRNFISGIAKAFLPFTFGDSYFGLAIENNKIVEQYRDPRFRKALKYMAGLYSEGLIERDSFSMTNEQLMGIARSEEPLAAVVGSSWVNGFAAAGTQRFAEYFAVPPLKGPTGEQWASNTDIYGAVIPVFLVTDKCKDPELAIAFLDYVNGLPKGDPPDPGALGINGEPALWKAIVRSSPKPINSDWDDGGNNPILSYTQAEMYGSQATNIAECRRYLQTMDKSLLPQVLKGSYFMAQFYYFSMEAQKHALPASIFIPPQILNDVDNARVSDISAVLDPFKIQAFVEFITGTRNINSDANWASYLAELDRLGSPELVAIRQKYIK